MLDIVKTLNILSDCVWLNWLPPPARKKILMINQTLKNATILEVHIYWADDRAPHPLLISSHCSYAPRAPLLLCCCIVSATTQMMHIAIRRFVILSINKLHVSGIVKRRTISWREEKKRRCPCCTKPSSPYHIKRLHAHFWPYFWLVA